MDSNILDLDNMRDLVLSKFNTNDFINVDYTDNLEYNKAFISAYNEKLHENKLRESLADELAAGLKSGIKDVKTAEETADEKYNVVYNVAAQVFQGRGIKHFAFICGDPGIGKSFSVKQAMKQTFPTGKLKEQGYKTWWDKGDIGKSLSSVLAYFYKHREKEVLILDDCDGFLTNKDQAVQNILKGLLELDNTDSNPAFITAAANIRNRANNDLNAARKEKEKEAEKAAKQAAKVKKTEEGTEFIINKSLLKEAFDFSSIFNKNVENSDNETRIEDEDEIDDIVYNIPERWRFTSRIIFISNLRQKDINSAVDTRTTVYELTLTQDEFLARLLKVLPNMLTDVESTNSPEEIKYARDVAYAYIVAAIDLAKKGLITVNRQLEFRLVSEFAGRWLLYHDLWCEKNNFVPQNDTDRNFVNNKIKTSFFKNEVIPYLKRNRKSK